MIARIALASFLLTALFAISGGSTSASPKAPTCFGHRATQWLLQPGTLYGTPGDDVLVGSSGGDQLFSDRNSGRVDYICGLGGIDSIYISGIGSKANAGDDSDQLYVYDGAWGTGGAGDDWDVRASGAGSVAEGGSGNDIIWSFDSSQVTGGAGNDTIKSFGQSVANGESGNDVINSFDDSTAIGGSGSDTVLAYNQSRADGGSGDDSVQSFSSGRVSGGSGNDALLAELDGANLYGGSGSDSLNDLGHADIRLDCGSGVDSYASSGPSTTVIHCE